MASPSVASRSQKSARAAGSEDVIAARALEFADWAKRNARLVIGTTVLLGAILAGLVYYYYFDKPRREEKAAVQFMQLERTAMAGNPALAQKELDTFIRRYDGTVQADEARLMLARQYLESNQPAKAIPVLNEVSGGVDTPLGAQAGLLLGAAQAQAKQVDAAIQSLLRVADGSETLFYQQEALSDAALLHQQARRHREAAELWRRLAGTAEEGSM
ncbi:MAG: tetratricopeptide repeat protein, partial [Gemmatimonadota bacterium]|nr:tetratricopeptide repeat protein [Gemmatimonadota bacterium]